MNTRILNRAGQLPNDGWYQIEAPGEHINHRARVVQIIDEAAITSIVNRFAAEAKAENFAGQRIDKDHLSHSEEHATEALGWAMELRNRAGIPEAKIDWTGLGLPLIESAPGKPPVYKFFSTEYAPSEVEKLGTRLVNGKPYALVRPLRLDGLSLTNDPNNRGQRPISNRRDGGSENQPTDIVMNRLLKALGLADGASEDSALAALQVITNRASSAEADLVATKTERDDLLGVQIEADLEKYKNRYKPENREKLKKQLIANRASTIELLDSLAEPVAPHAPITNRGQARTPKVPAEGEAQAEQANARANKISNRAAALRREQPSLTISQSYDRAEAELADN